MATKFTTVYNRFLNKITDDMYLEWTYAETLNDMQNLLLDAIPGFEFPRKSLDYNLLPLTVKEDNSVDDDSSFVADLSDEEINILALLMMVAWTQRQVTSIENIRMKYSGTDFKFTSQANHLAKLLALLQENQCQAFHMQRLYKRRIKKDDGSMGTSWTIFGRNEDEV